MTNASSRPPAAALWGPIFALALVAAACGNDAATTDASQSARNDDAMGGHEHGDVLDVPSTMTVPEVSLRVSPDPKSGINLFVDLTDFEIAPRAASTEPVDGQGHLHLYVDGERRMRFYNTALHLPDLAEGEHEIAVEVSANDHTAYAVDGVPIRATQSVTVEASDHQHGDTELHEVTESAAPTLAIEAFEDPKSGWNLLFTTDLTISPESASTEPVDGEGHLHLYVDGERLGRIYGPWWHLPALPAGEHEVAIEASANNHAAYAVDGAPVRASTTITVTADQAAASSPAGDHDSTDHDGTDHDSDAAAADGADVTVEAAVTGDQVEVDGDRVEVPLGSTISIVVTTDRSDHVHVHGYDHLVDAAPGEEAEITFVADVPGVFEVELEDAGLFLFELAVR